PRTARRRAAETRARSGRVRAGARAPPPPRTADSTAPQDPLSYRLIVEDTEPRVERHPPRPGTCAARSGGRRRGGGDAGELVQERRRPPGEIPGRHPAVERPHPPPAFLLGHRHPHLERPPDRL